MVKQYGMVIDLQKCVGCGCCTITCKTENNTQARANGQTFNWSDVIFREGGTFPKVSFSAIPVLCNHCGDAPCVKACPVNPKAMYKTADGITMHNDERCIGCRRCQKACPYSAMDVDKEKAAYSVISANDPKEAPHAPYRDATEMIKGCTASGAEVAKVAGASPPYQNQYSHPDYMDIRQKGIVEKCIFCAHRLQQGEQPYCVVSCPAKARIFGDLNDASGEPAVQLKKFKSFRLKEEKKTRPNVSYIRNFKGGKPA